MPKETSSCYCGNGVAAVVVVKIVKSGDDAGGVIVTYVTTNSRSPVRNS